MVKFSSDDHMDFVQEKNSDDVLLMSLLMKHLKKALVVLSKYLFVVIFTYFFFFAIRSREEIPIPLILNVTTNVSTREFYPHLGVIIEFRRAAMLITVVHNVIYNLPSSWPIQIFHGKQNENFIRTSTLKPLIKQGKVFLTLMEKTIKKEGTNALLTDRRFWERVQGEKILFFQIDSIMCSNSPHRITDFLQYDYVGAPWDPLWFSFDQEFLVGNGGFSLRSRNKTLTLIDQYPYDPETPEDVWFGSNLHRVGGNVPKIDEAKKFAVESYFYPQPVGVHRFNLNCSVRNELFKTCPEAKLVMLDTCQ